jgi:hypothetical protein
MFLTLKPTCVIGYTSTSLANARVLYNIPAISMTSILLERSNDELLNALENEFKKLTSDINNIFHINSLEEIKDILDDMKAKNKMSEMRVKDEN